MRGGYEYGMSQTHEIGLMSRREALLAAMAVAGLGMYGCSRSGAAGALTLYSSADDDIAALARGAFTKRSGRALEIVGDTEATKTFGLVARLIDERSSPRADAWWSNEPLGSVRLAEEGVLAPLPGSIVGSAWYKAWPAYLKDPRDLWIGFGLRARAIAYHTRRVRPEEAPASARELALPRWKGRVGMAKPQFGTTRLHMAAILVQSGEAAMRGWLEGLRAGGVRLYDGNSSVVRAMSVGEIDVGLTDSDDVRAGMSNGWPVGMVLERPAPEEAGAIAARGTVTIPNTVGLVGGGPGGAAAVELLEFLVSAEMERLLAGSVAGYAPVRAEVAAEFPAAGIGSAAELDYAEIGRRSAEAIALFEGVFAGG
jgi:iron(III) transport system substrate-binding protein